MADYFSASARVDVGRKRESAGMKSLNLDAMSVDQLLELRDRVSAILAERVVTERQELERAWLV